LDGLFYQAAHDGKLIIVSPNINGWIGLGGGSTTFWMRVFKENNYSGMLFEQAYEEESRLLEEDKKFVLWSYQVWENGHLLDRFFSNPTWIYEFAEATSFDEILGSYFYPENDRDSPANDSPEKWEVFQKSHLGNIDLLKEKGWLKQNASHLSGTTADNFSPSYEGFERFLSSLIIPYAKIDYDASHIGIYLDVISGRLDITKSPNFIDIYQKTKSLPDIENLSWTLLDIKERDKRQVLYS
jgi:hypothetical protein